MSNYYDILKVKTNASQPEIKSAYKRLALLHHPDRNQGRKESEETFKSIYEAYKILSNTSKRRVYDKANHIYAYSEIKYNHHQGGFYSSVLHKNGINKSAVYKKPEVFVSKKRDLDFYLFWGTLAFIFILTGFLLTRI